MPSTSAWLPLPLSYEPCSRHRVGETPLVTHEPRKGVMGGSGFEDSSFYPFHQIATRLAILALDCWLNVSLLYLSINDVDQLICKVLYCRFGFGIVLAIGNHR